MRPVSRVLIILAALLIAAVFIFPLWQFEIWAPQYPEGLFMQVWISKITGDVRNINVLNHYVGMKPILAEGLPELKLFPWIFGSFALSGLLVAAVNWRRVFFAWALALFVFASAALFDFYQWEYKFGTELSEDAPIKMEETYQPPLIGMKTMMNIEAWSLPAAGGYALTGALALVFGTCWIERRKKVEDGFAHWNGSRSAGFMLAVALGGSLVATASACTSREPQAILVGKDSCNACRMVVADSKFGAEVVTAKGKVYKFDSLECMEGFLRTLADAKDARIYVPDATAGGRLIVAESASFGLDSDKQGPMGRYILAGPSAESLKKIPGVHLTETFNWMEVRGKVQAHLQESHK
jgi:copper chaperone NosL